MNFATIIICSIVVIIGSFIAAVSSLSPFGGLLSTSAIVSRDPTNNNTTNKVSKRSVQPSSPNQGTVHSKDETLRRYSKQVIMQKEQSSQDDYDDDDDDNDCTKHYIFGYGSLLCPQSRAISAPTLAGKDAHPVLVQHLARTWSTRIYHTKTARVAISSSSRNINDTAPPTTAEGNDMGGGCHSWIEGQTVMGVRQAINQTCSGVLFEVDAI